MVSPSNRLWRRLLELDRPASQVSQTEFEAQVARHYRWNFSVNLIEIACFWFGLSFISSATVVPLYIGKLTSSTLALGLAAMIAQGAWYLPQLLTAGHIERLDRKKPVIVNLGFFAERLPMWIIVLSAVLAVRSPALALVLFFLGYAWHGLGAGLVATSWQDLIARCFPAERRGRFLGTSLFFGGAVGAAGAVLSGRLLEAFPFSTNFAYNFLLAALFINLSWIFLSWTREPVQKAAASTHSIREYLSRAPDVLRHDPNFRRFLASRLMLAAGLMGTGFVTASAVARWNVPDSAVGAYTAALLIGQTAANLGLGFLADRFGHKLTLELGILAAVAAFLIAWLAPSPGWYYAVFALLGVNLGAIVVSGILVVLEFAPPEKRPTYAGVANTSIGLVSITAPLIGAWLAIVSYDLLFALSAAVTLISWLLLRFRVREPRWGNPVVQ